MDFKSAIGALLYLESPVMKLLPIPFTLRMFVTTSLIAVLAACGGGGDLTPHAPVYQQPVTGKLVDSPVWGLTYATGSVVSRTNERGEFTYIPGDDITFSVGSVRFPTVKAEPTITPLTLAGTTDVNNQIVVNILVLLQSLDGDADPENGIAILPIAANNALRVLNFDVSPAQFAANADVKYLIANSGSVNKTPVSPEAAIAHFLHQPPTTPSVPGTPYAGTYKGTFTGEMNSTLECASNASCVQGTFTLTISRDGSAIADMNFGENPPYSNGSYQFTGDITPEGLLTVTSPGYQDPRCTSRPEGVAGLSINFDVAHTPPTRSPGVWYSYGFKSTPLSGAEPQATCTSVVGAFQGLGPVPIPILQ